VYLSKRIGLVPGRWHCCLGTRSRQRGPEERQRRFVRTGLSRTFVRVIRNQVPDSLTYATLNAIDLDGRALAFMPWWARRRG
jgi:hypothetical protein